MEGIKEKIDRFKRLVTPPHLASIPASTSALYSVFTDPDCDEETKNDCMDRLVDVITWNIRNVCAIELLYEFSSPFENCSVGFMREVLNHPRVIDSFQKACVSSNYRFYIRRVVEHIEFLFEEENVQKILRRRNKNIITFTFGHHNVILQDIKLQKKWIKAYLRYKDVTPIFGIKYVTNEAIESLPLEISHAFIRKIINHLSPRLMRFFDLEVIERIAIMYVVTHGKNKDSDLILERVKEYQSTFDFSQRWR